MSRIQKAEASSDRNGLNKIEKLAGFSTPDYGTKSLEKQLILSGAVEKLATDLTEHLKQHRVIRIGTRCTGCKQSFLPQKLIINVLMCRKCLCKAQEEPLSKQNRFIAEAAQNYVTSLRYQISAGGLR